MPARITPWIAEAGRSDRAGGVSLTLATVAALVWANAAPGAYHTFWRTVPWQLTLAFSWQDWTDQGLMFGFFLLIGLEIRRAISRGELRTWRRASVPVTAAAAGMLLPAALYASLTWGSAGARGWGIPMATDVAFALGALAILGAGTGGRLRVFLMTLAVADDIASIIVLVVFYGSHIHPGALVAGIGALGVMWALAAAAPHGPRWPLVLLSGVAWWAMATAGVEAAVIGAALGLVLPARAGAGVGAARWELRLRPWVNLVILPAFALANAGFPFAGSGLLTAPAVRVFAAVAIARVIGKPGAIVATLSALKRPSAGRPEIGAGRREHTAVGAVAAIGYTVPLLIVRRALPDGPLAAGATAGLLAASLVGGLAAALLFRSMRIHPMRKKSE